MKITERRLKQIIKEEMEFASIEIDHEGQMAKSQLENIAQYAAELASMLEDDTQLEGWVQSKITLAQDYISKAKHYLEDELGLEGGGCGEDVVPIEADSFIIDDEFITEQ